MNQKVQIENSQLTPGQDFLTSMQNVTGTAFPTFQASSSNPHTWSTGGQPAEKTSARAYWYDTRHGLSSWKGMWTSWGLGQGMASSRGDACMVKIFSEKGMWDHNGGNRPLVSHSIPAELSWPRYPPARRHRPATRAGYCRPCARGQGWRPAQMDRKKCGCLYVGWKIRNFTPTWTPRVWSCHDSCGRWTRSDPAGINDHSPPYGATCWKFP